MLATFTFKAALITSEHSGIPQKTAMFISNNVTTSNHTCTSRTEELLSAVNMFYEMD
jgi:hypothetical protein